MSPSRKISSIEVRRPNRARALTAAALAALAMSAAACASPPPSSSRPPAAIRPNLATSLVTTGGAWATVPTSGFWQVLFMPSGTDRWTLATPPGVADNGGVLVVPAGTSGMLAAFRPSERLSYTPLARKTSATTPWRAAGIIESSLTPTPAAISAGPGSEYAALLGGGTEVRISGRGGRIATESVHLLRATSKGAGLRRFTGVAWSARLGVALLAGASSRAGVVPVFAGPPGAVALLGAAPPQIEDSTVTVLDISAGPSAVSALLLASGTHGKGLEVGNLPSGSGTWRVGAAIPLSKGSEAPVVEPLGATGWLYWAGGGSSIYVTASAASGWVHYASPPSRTSGLAAVAGGGSLQLYAFATRSGSDIVEVYRFRAGSWSLSQALSVPLQLGG